jgi:hypothetical protein
MRLPMVISVGAAVAVAFVSSIQADTFPVTTTAESGPGSLKQAILDANGHGGADVISFNISGAGVHTITPSFANQLPPITDSVTIDGSTQPGFAGTPLIEISGAIVTNNGNALVIAAGAPLTTIRSLVINHGWSSGILLQASNCVIEACFIGTDPTGTSASGNTIGVGTNFGNVVTGCRIGGTAATARNLISGNSTGILLNSGATNNLVQGNFIGTDISGDNSLANAVGVDLRDSNNTVGGNSIAARNIIAGGNNGSMGVSVSNASASVIQGNFIGTDRTGTKAFSFSDGIFLSSGATNTQIGGLTSTPGIPPGNVISGARAGGGSGHGIVVAIGVSFNIIQGNLIGTDATGTKALGNGVDGIQISGMNNTVGGGNPMARNVISGNAANGVALGNNNTVVSGNVIQNNFIGTKIDGSSLLGNGGNGVLAVASMNNSVGGASTSGNVIAGNGGAGVSVDVSGGPVAGLIIRGNSIFSNGGLGIDLNANGVTLNDAGDVDTGGNSLQNYPIINAVTVSAPNVNIVGALHSEASKTYRLEFFGNSQTDPSGFGEGQTLLGFADATTDVSGNASYNLTFPVPAATATYSATATDPLGNTSEFSPAFRTRLRNISTRMRVLTSDNVLIAGFIVVGNGPKKVIVRGIGPSIPVGGTLVDPTLELHGSVFISNDNWKVRDSDGTSQQAEIEATTIPPNRDAESAIVASLDPGNYTAILAGKNSTSGIGLVEVYDLDASAGAYLANISSRGFVDTNDNVMIGGFIIDPTTTGPQKVIIRAIGPSLSASNVPNALADPFLELHDGNGATISTNNNWKINDSDGTSQQAEVEATTIPPTDDHESALVRTLAPGNYTAIVRGLNNTTGIGLVEVYSL